MMSISECSLILTCMTAFDQEPRVKSFIFPNHIYFPQISGRSLILILLARLGKEVLASLIIRQELANPCKKTKMTLSFLALLLLL